MTKRIYTRTSDDPKTHTRRYTRHLMGDAITSLPNSVDLRPGCSPVENQGNTSSCTGHAICGAIEYDENVFRAPGTPFKAYSRLFIYYNERLTENDVNQDAGASISDGIQTLVKYGACPEEAWPFSENEVLVKPSLEAYAEAAYHKAVGYENLDQQLDVLMHCLAVTQRPIVFGIMVYESFESDDVARHGIVPMPQPDEQCMGGHAVLIVGYDMADRTFLVRNSWGEDWGIQGYFKLPFDYVLNPNLAEDFWIIEQGSF